MRFLLGFIFGAFYTGNRAFRAAFLLIILIRSSGSTRCRNLLATIGELLRLERRPAESDYCALMLSPHVNCCQDAVDRGKMGGNVRNVGKRSRELTLARKIQNNVLVVQRITARNFLRPSFDKIDIDQGLVVVARAQAKQIFFVRRGDPL